MAGTEISPGETVYFDVTTSLFDLTFPVLEGILITGICWMGIGVLDRPGVAFNPTGRSILLFGWLFLLVWRVVLPVVRARRRRFIITDQRILLRPATLRAGSESIPLTAITKVDHAGSSIGLSVTGNPEQLWFPKISKTKKAVSILNQLLHSQAW